MRIMKPQNSRATERRVLFRGVFPPSGNKEVLHFIIIIITSLRIT